MMNRSRDGVKYTFLKKNKQHLKICNYTIDRETER